MLARVHDQEIEIGEGPMPPQRECQCSKGFVITL
jgi:hypothetical protein